MAIKGFDSNQKNMNIKSYTVKSGDTLSQIAKDHNMSYQELADYNNISDADYIVTGSTIKIPKETIDLSTETNYTVQSGDTLSQIAKDHNVSYQDLADYNNISDPDYIVTGSTIRIPKQQENTHYTTPEGLKAGTNAQKTNYAVTPEGLKAGTNAQKTNYAVTPEGLKAGVNAQKTNKGNSPQNINGQITEIPYISQNDKRWQEGPYDTISSTGGPLAFAMIASYLLDKMIYPDEILLDEEHIKNGGDEGDYFKNAAEAFNLGEVKETTDINEVIEALKNGHPVISQQGPGIFTHGKHYIVLRGITDDEKILMHDPSGKHEEYSHMEIPPFDIDTSAINYFVFDTKKQDAETKAISFNSFVLAMKDKFVETVINPVVDKVKGTIISKQQENTHYTTPEGLKAGVNAQKTNFAVTPEGLKAGTNAQKIGNVMLDIFDNKNINEIYDFFADKGLNPVTIAAILGNMQAENSTFNLSCNWERLHDPDYPSNAYSDQYGNIKYYESDIADIAREQAIALINGLVPKYGGIGLIQLTGGIYNSETGKWDPGKYSSRKADYLNWCNKNKKVWDDLETQLEYIWLEYETWDRKDEFESIESVQDAAAYFCNYNEQPGDDSTTRRMEYAQNFYDQIIVAVNQNDTISQNIKENEASQEEQITEIPYLSQNDERWNAAPYPYVDSGSNTMGASACGPSSFAMVASYLLDKMIYPDEVLLDGDYHVNSGTLDTYFKAAAEAFDLGEVKETKDINEVIKALKNGQPVISRQGPGIFTNAGHFVVLRGITDDGKILVHDPNGRHEEYSQMEFPPADIDVSAVNYFVFDTKEHDVGTKKLSFNSFVLAMKDKFVETVIDSVVEKVKKMMTTEYTVKRGDTLSKIAKDYNMSYQELAEYNHISDPNNIAVGTVLKIPAKMGNQSKVSADTNTNVKTSNIKQKTVDIHVENLKPGSRVKAAYDKYKDEIPNAEHVIVDETLFFTETLVNIDGVPTHVYHFVIEDPSQISVVPAKGGYGNGKDYFYNTAENCGAIVAFCASQFQDGGYQDLKGAGCQVAISNGEVVQSKGDCAGGLEILIDENGNVFNSTDSINTLINERKVKYSICSQDVKMITNGQIDPNMSQAGRDPYPRTILAQKGECEYYITQDTEGQAYLSSANYLLERGVTFAKSFDQGGSVKGMVNGNIVIDREPGRTVGDILAIKK